MSLYDDVILPDFGVNSASVNKANNNSLNNSNSSQANNKTETQNDIASWNSNSLKLLQYQVEAAKKRQLTLSSAAALKRDKPSTSIAPVIDLSDKRKPQLQLKKDSEYLNTSSSNNTSFVSNELRFNSFTGKVEKENAGSLYSALSEEYDPMRPNEYEKLVNELSKQISSINKPKSGERNREDESHSKERRRHRREKSRDRRRHSRSSSGERRDRDKKRRSSGSSRDRDRDRDRKRHGRHISSSSSDEEDRRRRRQEDDLKNKKPSDESNKRNNLFAPPPSLIEAENKIPMSEPNNEDLKQANSSNKALFGGLLKAEKMMAKMGYKEGEGLGRNNQGMSIALQVEKTGKRSGRIIHEKDAPETPAIPTPIPVNIQPLKEPTTPVGIPTEVMKNMSKVVLLRNMVIPGEVDDDLEAETKEECQKYGEVNRCIIFEMPNRSQDEAVRIFLEFKTLPSAIKALTDLNGRFFGGRVVKATFYNLDKFKRLELADDV